MKTAVTSIFTCFVFQMTNTQQKAKWAAIQVTILLDDHRHANIRTCKIGETQKRTTLEWSVIDNWIAGGGGGGGVWKVGGRVIKLVLLDPKPLPLLLPWFYSLS